MATDLSEGIPRKQSLLREGGQQKAFSSAQLPKSHVAPKGKKRNWGRFRNSLSRTPYPHPHPKFTGSPSLLPLVSFILSPSGPLSFPQQPSPQSALILFSATLFPAALPAPISPPPSPPRPFQHPRPSSSHPFPAPTSVGWGAWGAGPLPSQSAAAVVAGGCVSASVGVVGAKGATGFGGVLAPADGGEVRVGGWAHSGRNGGGLSPQVPPSLSAVSLRAGAAAAAIPPPLPNACWFPGLVRK